MHDSAMLDLYLESGPQRKTTMVHVPALLGCVTVGPTTEQALAEVDAAIRAYRRFLVRCGEAVDPQEAIVTRVAEHVTEGGFLGRGSPQILFASDLEPVGDEELVRYRHRFQTMRAEVLVWAEQRSDAELDAEPEGGGWSARRVLTHLVGPPGGYLSAALGSAPGFSALSGALERDAIDVREALRREAVLVDERLARVTAEERAAVVERSTSVRTLRKAIRRLLEHEWEHRCQLARRPGGPSI